MQSSSLANVNPAERKCEESGDAVDTEMTVMCNETEN